jgi:uncharacterized membrane protein
MNKALIAPIIALVILFSQRLFHMQWSSEDVQTINDGILSLAILIGIFTNPKKPE